MKRYLSILVFFIILISDIKSQTFIKKEPLKSSRIFKTIYEKEKEGLGFELVGQSLQSKKNEFLSNSTITLKKQKIEKAFIVWMGKRVKDYQQAVLNIGREKFIVKAKETWRKDELFLSYADVTKELASNESVEFNNVLHEKGFRSYLATGWGLILITSDASKMKSNVIVKLGVDKFNPGEIHEIKVLEEQTSSLSLKKIGLIGGNGISGNGSSNFINNSAITGKDDWNSSSGYRLDFDTFNILKQHPLSKISRLALQIDPLMQWIFPFGVIIQWTK